MIREGKTWVAPSRASMLLLGKLQPNKSLRHRMIDWQTLQISSSRQTMLQLWSEIPSQVRKI